MKRKIAIYARVSTEHEAQISALENQVQYYDEILKRYPDWELYDRYIDEGITGTSVNKRDNFIRMMNDAKNQKFDLIITREVSRFARNTVDTLQQTRVLKTYGVEVWFIEDNIWTMNDEDGELRLSIMATLAQNESKKISMRVKAGQKISFMNGVLYGNGNILGYDKVGKEFTINKEQADTVKRIFDLRLQGMGARKIQYILEQEGRKNASGKIKWYAGNIIRILNNSFYCGRIEYRKQYVPDYLAQKKVNNHGEVEKIIVKGTHPTIITEEEFDKVQQLIKESTVEHNNKKYGKSTAKSIWVKKLKCKCGYGMHRRLNYVAQNGDKTFTYQCTNQKETGTVQTRLNKGLSTDGICDNSTFSEWKLEVQADFIFRKLLNNKQEIYNTAMDMIQGTFNSNSNTLLYSQNIENNIKEIDKLKHRLDNLLDMCTDGDISRETFRSKKNIIENKINTLEEANNELREKINNNKIQDDINSRIERLSEFLKVHAFDKKEKIPEIIIDRYVDKIIYDKNIFTWYLKSDIGNISSLEIDMKDIKKKSMYDQNFMYIVNDNSGCNS